MKEVERIDELRETLGPARGDGRTIGFVPTMGYLHEGHLRLVTEAHAENDIVVVSIFVNPTQFGPSEDFSRYPRDLDRDRQLAEANGVDLLFTPSVEELYPGGQDAQTVWVEPGLLAAHLCGASRPGHFRGVATVVAKLFNIVGPDRAYFGQKDAQQTIIIERMVRDLSFPVELRVVPTVREPDGLALSSRNAYLGPDQRKQAVALWEALQAARRAIEHGEKDVEQLKAKMEECIAELAPDARIDYVECAGLSSLEPVAGDLQGDALLALAVYFGPTRLIDNLIVRFADGVPQFS